MTLRKLPIWLAAGLLLAVVTVGVARAQGSPVRDFTVQKAGGGDASLTAYADRKAVVVVFLNPGCAFSRLYQERLSALQSAFEGRGVAFMFITAPINLDAGGDGGANLAAYTDNGAAAGALGVSKTTEAVVLQPSGGTFAVRYRGAIDDNPQVAGDVRQAYLRQVLDNLLAGRPIGVADTRAAGCLIKK